MCTDEYFIEPARRRQMRLPGCDYSREGPYFVTICTYAKRCTLGAVTGDVVTLTRVGVAVREAWLGLPERFSTVVLDEFIVMPNHVHGVIAFVGAGFTPPGVGTETVSAMKQDRRPSLSDVICAFKSLSTRMARLKGHDGVLWQRGYYEHIVRDGEDMGNVQRYIVENPLRWGLGK
jgi:putative transposase